jgi:hypothetical protein
MSGELDLSKFTSVLTFLKGPPVVLPEITEALILFCDLPLL